MRTINNFAALALLTTLILPSAKAEVMEQVAVKINNEPVMMSEYVKTKEMLTEQYRSAMPDFFRQKDAKEQIDKAALDKLIDEALLRQKAEALKVKVYDRELDNGVAEVKKRFTHDENNAPLSEAAAEEGFVRELRKEGLTQEQFRDKIKKQLMVRKLVEEAVRAKAPLPKEEEVKQYFDKIKRALNSDKTVFEGLDDDSKQELAAVAQRFKEFSAERIRARHILFKLPETPALTEKLAASKRAEEVKMKLNAGEDFEDLAAQYSDDKESAQRGGDLGYIVKGMLPKELEDKAFSLPFGEPSKPFLSQFGYHIMRIDEKRITQKLKFEQVKEELEQMLAQSNFGRELADYLKGLRKDAKIQNFTAQK